MGVPAGKLYFADDGYSCLLHLLYHWGVLGNPRAFDNLVRVQYQALRMPVLFPWNALFLYHFLVVGLDASHVAEEYVKALLLCQYCGTHAAFCGS